MKRIFNNKVVHSIFVILFLVILLETQSFADHYFIQMRIPDIIYYNLEWCIYLLIPSILVLIGGLIFKLINRTKSKKIVSVLLIISIICLAIVGIEFAIHHIGFKEIAYYIEYRN